MLVRHREHSGGGIAPRRPRARCSARPGFRPDGRAAPRRRSGSSGSSCPARDPSPGDTTGTHGRSSFASWVSTARKPCDGTPMTMTSASRDRLLDRSRSRAREAANGPGDAARSCAAWLIRRRYVAAGPDHRGRCGGDQCERPSFPTTRPPAVRLEVASRIPRSDLPPALGAAQSRRLVSFDARAQTNRQGRARRSAAIDPTDGDDVDGLCRAKGTPTRARIRPRGRTRRESRTRRLGRAMQRVA